METNKAKGNNNSNIVCGLLKLIKSMNYVMIFFFTLRLLNNLLLLLLLAKNLLFKIKINNDRNKHQEKGKKRR